MVSCSVCLSVTFMYSVETTKCILKIFPPSSSHAILVFPHQTWILLASPPADWRRQLGRPRITWLGTVQQDLKQHHLTLPEAADLAQNRPLWRMMSTYGATQSWVARQKRRRRHQTWWQYSDRNSPNGDVECWRGRQKSRFSTDIWLHRMLWMVQLPSVIHTAAPDHGKLVTPVAG